MFGECILNYIILLNVDIFSLIVRSTNVFGVSTESMQLSFDARGNSVPTILLLMQRHLYAQGGLQVFSLALIPSFVGKNFKVI